jgi:hypothetical protein
MKSARAGTTRSIRDSIADALHSVARSLLRGLYRMLTLYRTVIAAHSRVSAACFGTGFCLAYLLSS